MSYHLLFHPEAEDEYLEAYKWYEDKMQRLGDRFERMIDACLSK